MNCGSALSLNVSTRCGFSPNARQIRPMVDSDRPVSAAIEDLDQCVASRGVRSSVATITCSTWSSRTERGAPGRGSSLNPSSRSATNRRRHLPTVALEQPSAPATDTLSAPSAHPKMILDLNARAWADVARRDQRTSCSRSSPVNTRSALGRPVRAIGHSMTYLANSWRDTLMGAVLKSGEPVENLVFDTRDHYKVE